MIKCIVDLVVEQLDKIHLAISEISGEVNKEVKAKISMKISSKIFKNSLVKEEELIDKLEDKIFL